MEGFPIIVRSRDCPVWLANVFAETADGRIKVMHHYDTSSTDHMIRETQESCDGVKTGFPVTIKSAESPLR